MEPTAPTDKRPWHKVAWPWELEILVLLFVGLALLFSLGCCLYPKNTAGLPLITQADMIRRAMRHQPDLPNPFWTLSICGLYLLHILVARRSSRFLSSSLSHLVSPAIFAVIVHNRLYAFSEKTGVALISVSNTVFDTSLWLIGALVLTAVFVRFNLARILLGFKDCDWVYTTTSQLDRTFFKLIYRLTPLLYFPRLIRICPDGILIEGWFYIMPISFQDIRILDTVRGTAFAASSFCLATSLNSLARIETTDKSRPVLISPRHSEVFLRYCRQFTYPASPGADHERSRITAVGETVVHHDNPKHRR